MTDEHVFFQHGDEPDAANFAQAMGMATKCGYTLSGFGFAVNMSELRLAVDSGVAVVPRREKMETASPNIDPPEERSRAAHPVEMRTKTGMPLVDNELNYVYLDANIGTDSSPKVVVNQTPELPTTAALPIGAVDMRESDAESAKSESWFRVTRDGTLTFPNSVAITRAEPFFSPGTQLYALNSDRQFRVRDGGTAVPVGRTGVTSRVVEEGDELTVEAEESLIVLEYYDAKGVFTVKGDMLIINEEDE